MGPRDLPDIPISISSAEGFTLRRYEDRIAAALATLLDMKFAPPFSCDTEEHIAKTFRNANRAIENGNIDEARFLILVPAKLLQCLITINRYDENLLLEFKEDFHEVEFSRYYGVRCEVETARSLLLHSIDFDHPDPPDFSVNFEGAEVSIECTSIHVESSSQYRQKICDVIGKKDGNYSGGSTTLFIDITNILHDSSSNESILDSDQLKDLVDRNEDIFDWTLGSVMFWSYVYDYEEERYHHAYIRSDMKQLESNLRRFLDEYYPIGKFEGEQFDFPSQG